MDYVLIGLLLWVVDWIVLRRLLISEAEVD